MWFARQQQIQKIKSYKDYKEKDKKKNWTELSSLGQEPVSVNFTDCFRGIFGSGFSMTVDENTISQGTYLKEKLGEKGLQIGQLNFLLSECVLL